MRKIGSIGSDLIRGSSDPDRIFGMAGDDYLYGLDGDDRLFGGIDRDILYGGAGRDHVRGGDGNDQIREDVGGDDRLFGGDGDDSIVVDNSAVGGGGRSSARLYGGAGNDALSTVYSDAFIDGGDGFDTIDIYHGGKTTIHAGAGDDQVTVTSPDGRTVAFLGAGNDEIDVSPGNGRAIVSLGSGDDWLILRGQDESRANSTWRLVVTDFEPGLHDRVDLRPFMQDARINPLDPFGEGYFRLIQVGENAILQVDRDADGADWERLMTFREADAELFTTFNFKVNSLDDSGPLPHGMIQDVAALLV